MFKYYCFGSYAHAYDTCSIDNGIIIKGNIDQWINKYTDNATQMCDMGDKQICNSAPQEC